MDTALEALMSLARQDFEISESDVEVLLRVARDKNAPAGRYKRLPRKVPAGEPVDSARQ